jgi:O-antigen/teichoic acid export membrane protein
MAVCTAIHVVVTLIGDIGMRQAIIRSENGHDPTFLNTAWTVQILRGISIWSTCIVAACILYGLNKLGIFQGRTVYSDPTLPHLLVATSFTSVILSFQSMNVIALGRALDLRQNTIIEITQAILGFSISVCLAWLTQSIWSFIASSWITAVVGVTMGHLWLSGSRDRLAWDKNALRELAKFGKWASLSSFVGVLAMNGDRLLLGAWLTTTSLGQYSIASNLASVLDGIGGRIFASVSLPALSEIFRTRPDRLSEVFLRMRRWADICYVATSGLLFATGQTLVGLLYDPRYLPAGHMLQLLSLGLLLSRYGLAQEVYIALGKPHYLTVINAIKVVSLFVCVPLLYYGFGSDGAILGVALYLTPTVPLIIWLNHRHGLDDLKFELMVLAAWPVSWAVGLALVACVHRIGLSAIGT